MMLKPMLLTRRQLLATTIATTATVALPAQADEVDAALKRIVKARASLKTLQADFKQTRIIGLLATSVESTGQLQLVRPNRLRWELHAPDAVTYWVGPEGLALANAEGVTRVGKQAAGRFAAVLGDLMIMLGGDLTKLRQRYQLQVNKKPGQLQLTAIPKAKEVAKNVSRLRLVMDNKIWQVRRMEIHEPNGDQSLIVLGKVVRNQPIKPARMKPPRA